MKKLKYLLAISLIGFMVACSDDKDDIKIEPEAPYTLPAKEMRAAWITTAWELDWPLKTYEAEAQKKMYIDYLEKFKECNINTVFVQIRSMADAFYKSEYEPWSKFITGERDKDPGYDVLKFMVDEAHKRDMEFHAWMNPYRISTRAKATDQFSDMKMTLDPSMYIDFDLIRIYNPASPDVQRRIADIVEEVVANYDVDGIVFDDYFYPPQAIGTLDAEDYKTYGADYATVEDFRRANVNKAIKNVYDRIVTVNPGVVFTISPASDQSYNYNTLFADVTFWCQQGWVDVVMPQLYMSTGGAFKDRVHWWPQFSYKATPMIAYAMYKFGDPAEKDANFQTGSELEIQFQRASLEPKIKGSSLYTAKSFTDNRIDIVNTVKKIYQDPAVRPVLGRQILAAPTAASAVTLNGTTLSWQATSDVKSVVYVIPFKKNDSGDITGKGKEAKVVAITADKTQTVSIQGEYFVTTINAENVESAVSNFVEYK